MVHVDVPGRNVVKHRPHVLVKVGVLNITADGVGHESTTETF